jgi:ketosteroid isomerase-like protein
VGAVTSRRIEERLGLRFPRLLALVTRAWWRLPPHSRLRQALIRRTVQLGVEAANRQDYEAAFGLYDAGIELLVPPALVGMGFEPVVRGRAERARFEQRWRTEWGQFSYVTEEIRDLGTGVLVIGRMRGSGPSSGAAFDSEWADLFTISGGRVVREQVWLDHAEALGATDSRG